MSGIRVRGWSGLSDENYSPLSSPDVLSHGRVMRLVRIVTRDAGWRCTSPGLDKYPVDRPW